MADPFEVRMRFTNLLTHLSASTTSSLKTAHYALKHRDMDEDLHSCIIENLERGIVAPSSTSTAQQQQGQQQSNGSNNPVTGNTTSTAVTNNSAASMNNRANIMYFLEHFCEMAIREGHQPYVEFVRRDIGKIVNCVAASGANVKVVRNVVGQLGNKGVLDVEVVTKIEEDLKLKEQERGQLLGDGEGEDSGQQLDDKTAMGDLDATGLAGEAETGKKSVTMADAGNRSVPRTGGKDSKPNGVSKADKRAIEQRIEEDRERNKRLREGVWAVNGDDEFELEKMWDEVSDLSEDDFIIADEEGEERGQFARYHRSLLER